jgi:hypothetical protein
MGAGRNAKLKPSLKVKTSLRKQDLNYASGHKLQARKAFFHPPVPPSLIFRANHLKHHWRRNAPQNSLFQVAHSPTRFMYKVFTFAMPCDTLQAKHCSGDAHWGNAKTKLLKNAGEGFKHKE